MYIVLLLPAISLAATQTVKPSHNVWIHFYIVTNDFSARLVKNNEKKNNKTPCIHSVSSFLRNFFIELENIPLFFLLDGTCQRWRMLQITSDDMSSRWRSQRMRSRWRRHLVFGETDLTPMSAVELLVFTIFLTLAVEIMRI